MRSNQNLKFLYFLVNQVKDFQAAQGKKKLEGIVIRMSDNFPDPSQCKPLNLCDRLPCCGNNLHHQ